MLVKDFLKKYPNDNFQMMTPGGYVDLSPQRAKELLAGNPVAAHPGESGCKDDGGCRGTSQGIRIERQLETRYMLYADGSFTGGGTTKRGGWYAGA
ncbi:MAG: hypothetical protein ACLUAR_13750 [Pilosibacter sp.]